MKKKNLTKGLFALTIVGTTIAGTSCTTTDDLSTSIYRSDGTGDYTTNRYVNDTYTTNKYTYDNNGYVDNKYTYDNNDYVDNNRYVKNNKERYGRIYNQNRYRSDDVRRNTYNNKMYRYGYGDTSYNNLRGDNIYNISADNSYGYDTNNLTTNYRGLNDYSNMYDKGTGFTQYKKYWNDDDYTKYNDVTTDYMNNYSDRYSSKDIAKYNDFTNNTRTYNYKRDLLDNSPMEEYTNYSSNTVTDKYKNVTPLVTSNVDTSKKEIKKVSETVEVETE